MRNIRLIARLDIKSENLIKSVHFEGLRKIGDPRLFAQNYFHDGIDELLFVDVVASLYGRNNLSEIIQRAADDIFIPITVAGGIRSIEDARHILRSGADKVGLNTAAVANPNLISDIATNFGSQATVLSIEAKRISEGRWEAYTDNGRERTGLDAIEWAKRGVELGAGEILVTSIDAEGTRNGFEVELIRTISDCVSVPVIASGGMGSLDHMLSVVNDGHADAVAMADVLHYKRLSIADIRNSALSNGLPVRNI